MNSIRLMMICDGKSFEKGDVLDLELQCEIVINLSNMVVFTTTVVCCRRQDILTLMLFVICLTIFIAYFFLDMHINSSE